MKKIIWLILLISIVFTGCKSKDEKAQNKKEGYCTISVDCSAVFDHIDDLKENLKNHIPKDGIILKKTKAAFQEGESVYDVLERTLQENGILMEASFTGDLAYIEGIDNLYEFSCGELSGWMYCVNGKYPNVGCSSYKVKDGDEIEWNYTCDMGSDLGQEYQTEYR